MPFLPLLMWIKNNWKIAAVGALLAYATLTVYQAGEAHVQAKWDKAETAWKQKVLDAENKAQDVINSQAALYEKDLKKRNTELAETRRRLANEKARNAAFASCHAGDEFMRIYETAAPQ